MAYPNDDQYIPWEDAARDPASAPSQLPFIYAPNVRAQMVATANKKKMPVVRQIKELPDATQAAQVRSKLGLMSQQVQQAQLMGRQAGALNSAGEQIQENNQRTENMPAILPRYQIEPGHIDYHATAEAKQRDPNHPDIERQSVLGSLNALKKGLTGVTGLEEGIPQGLDLRAKLAPYMAGHADLSPTLSYIASRLGVKIDAPQDRAPGTASELIKQADTAQGERAKAAAVEDSLLKDIIFPQAQKLVLGSTTKTEAKSETPKPMKSTGAGVNQKDIDAYMKMTAGGSSLLNNLRQQEGVLKTIPDNYNKSVGDSLLNRLRYGAADIVGDVALTPQQKQLDAIRSTIVQQVNSGLGLHRWNTGEADNLKKTLGVGSTASKEKILAGINYVRSLEQQAYQDAEAAHPEGAAVVQGRGRPGSKDFAATPEGAIMQGAEAPAAGAVGPHGARVKQGGVYFKYDPATKTYVKE